MPRLPGKFVWFDCVTRDVDAAQRFYGEVLGWKVEAFPVGDFSYAMLKAGDTPVGGFETWSSGAPQWLSSISVADVDATVAAVVAAGGSVLEPPSELTGVGRSAKVADPQGVPLYVLRGLGDDAADHPAGHGEFHWNELHTTDGAAALAFYQRVFGYTHMTRPSPAGRYHVLEKDGVQRGGIIQYVPAGTRPQWLPYVAVDDCDAALARAVRAGGAVRMPADTIPEVGRIAVIADPAGAVLGLITPAR